MPNVLPSVCGGHSAIGPVKRTVTHDTAIVQFEDLSEQRWSNRSSLNTFALTYSQLSLTDRQALDAFIAITRGSFDSTWIFPLFMSPLPVNGNFESGLSGWAISTDGYNAFTTDIATSSQEPGKSFAHSRTNAVTIPANTNAITYVAATVEPCYTGQTVQAQFLYANLYGLGVPSGVSIGLQVVVNVLNAQSVLLQQLYGGGFTATGFNTGSVTVPITPVGAAQYQLILVPTIFNNSSSPATLTSNQLATLVTDVFMWIQGQQGAYANCAFEDDTFTWTENSSYPNQYDGSIRFRQTGFGGGLFTGTLGPFPTIQGCATGYPFNSTSAYYVVRNDMPSGRRIAYVFTGTSGLPSRALRAFTLTFPAISNADLAAIEQHFVSAQGTYRTFQFTDPTDGKVYSRVRYSSDNLQISHLYYNVNSVSVALQEVYGPGWTA